ncbi:MAG: hypothetical protein JO142_14865 [Burkholderiales bacterium]|nr:hypothetical protein [Burkholderiales bacterium]
MNSSLGQPLDVRIRINATPNEHLSKDCIYASLREGEEEGPRRKIGIDYIPDKEGGGWVNVVSEAVLGEPIMSVHLLVHCESDVRVRRNYMLLLDPPGANSNETRIVSPISPGESSTNADQRARGTHAEPGGPTSGESPRTMREGVNGAASAAPVRRHKHPPVPTTPAQPTPAPSESRSTPTAPATPQGRLTLSSPTAKANASAEEALKARESALNDQLAEQTAKLNDATDKIEKLEKQMGLLVNELARREREAAAANQARAAEIERAAQESRRHTLELAGLCGLAALLMAALLYTLSRRRKPQDEVPLLPIVDSPLETTLWQDAKPVPPPPRDRLDSLRERMPLSSPNESDMDVHFLNSVASEAAVMAAYGQVNEATGLLENEINRNPTQVVNWIQLLELYHAHRDVDAFIRRASDFRQRFASQALWEKVARMGQELAPGDPIFDALPESTWQMKPDDGSGLSAMLDAHADQRTASTQGAQPNTGVPTASPLIFDEPPAQQPASVAPVTEGPLLFELPGHAQHDGDDPLHLIDVPDAFADDEIGSLAHARAMIEAGQREEGAAMLQQIMMHGTIDERLAAADLLLRLTTPH